MTTTEQTQTTQQAVQQQAGKLVAQFNGYVGVKTMQMGLASGLLEALSKHACGMTAEQLARYAGTDPFYTGVWCRAAYASELVDVDEEGCYRLAPHMDKLLLNSDFPGFVGAIPPLFGLSEIFDGFSERLKSGERIWWKDTSPDFISAVSNTGWPFYSRLIPTGLEKVPGLTEKLSAGAKVLELASGAGRGLVKFASTFPRTEITGVDGDAHSIGLASQRVKEAGLNGRVKLTQSTLEDFSSGGDYDLVFINISMHECRDIDRVTENVKRALKPGGYFVISDFPFPATQEGLRTPPARLMSGIQFFEAQIDDQLVPTQVFVDLLGRHGFKDVQAFDISPLHNVIHGRK